MKFEKKSNEPKILKLEDDFNKEVEINDAYFRRKKKALNNIKEAINLYGYYRLSLDEVNKICDSKEIKR